MVETKFLELAMSLLDFSPWIPLGTFSILLSPVIAEDGSILKETYVSTISTIQFNPTLKGCIHQVEDFIVIVRTEMATLCLADLGNSVELEKKCEGNR